MPKIKKIKKEICKQVRKTRCNIATTGKKRVIGKSIEKWKAIASLLKFLKITKIREKKWAKEKKLE